MKVDYKNWMPKGMIVGFFTGAVMSLLLIPVLGCTTLIHNSYLRTFLTIALTVSFMIFASMTVWSYLMYKAFDYNGNRKMSKQIIEGTASLIHVPEKGTVLDVGCGSGALTIAVAKNHPDAFVIGIDRWGKEYSSFSRKLCEQNAEAEEVSNVRFQKGDAAHLDFRNETFDAVTSNYVYHNIPSKNRQDLILETLRTLKKGGSFVIHDIFSSSKYGDMQKFIKKLKDMGYQEVNLIDTTDGMFMSRSESTWMALSGSALLTGIK